MKTQHEDLARAQEALGRLRIALDEGRVDEAVDIAKEAIVAAPQYSRAISGLATALKRAGRGAEARTVLEGATPDVLGSRLDRVEMAALCLREGVAEPAKEILRSTLEAEPTTARAAELLARAYMRERDFGAVVAVCDPFRRRSQASPTLLRMLAAAYEQLGQLAEAAECARLYARSAPLDPRGHYHIATLEHRQGNVTEAMDRYDFAIELGGSDPQLTSAAADGIRALDAVQLRQITSLAAADTVFRISLQHNMQAALEERGFLLSEEGMALLGGMDLDALARPPGPHGLRYH